jgi:Spy/CpxP family protein refolding chaperone
VSKEDVMTQERRVLVLAGTVGMLIVAALLLATVVDAAAQGPRFGPGRGGPDGFIGDAGGSGGGRLALMRLASLTDEQRQQIRTLTQQRREGLAMLQRDVAEARRALSASADSGQVDESKAAELGQATGALALARARLQADVLAVLTPEQRAELATRREDMRKWLESRPGGRGGRPGRGGGRGAA